MICILSIYILIADFQCLKEGSKVKNQLNPLVTDDNAMKKPDSWDTVQFNWSVWPWVKRVDTGNTNFFFWVSISHYVINIF